MVFWKTKEWWTAVIVCFVPFVVLFTGIEIDILKVIAVVLPIIGLIIGADWAELAEMRRATARKKASRKKEN